MTVRDRIGACLTTLAAVVAHLWLQAGMTLTWPGWNASAFRNYYWPDQLSYLGIVTDVADGGTGMVEPFTETGTIYYPRAYYLALGYLASWTSTRPALVWFVCGLAVQSVLVAMISVTAILLTRRWWVGLVGFVPFLLGTGSFILGNGWLSHLGSHAVLWGPFGVMYTLNGETAALALGACALLAATAVAFGRVVGRRAAVLVVVAAFAIGLTANVQTYAFMASTYLLAFGSAAVGLWRRPRRWAPVATAASVVIVFTLGPVVARHASPLVVLVLGLLPAVPGLVQLARQVRTPFWVACGAFVLGASPQVVATVLGVLGSDAFLLYRDSSSVDLGVPPARGVWAGLAVVPWLLWVLVSGIRRRQGAWVAVPAALLFAWAMLASNDVWGANQEPYRLWLDVYVLVAAVATPVVAYVLDARWRARRATPVTRAERPPRVVGRLVRATSGPVASGVALAAMSAVTIAWSGDFLVFRDMVDKAGYLRLAPPAYQAATSLAERTDGSLVLTDACIDPTILKVDWGGPVVAYSRGLAWPAHVDDVDIALEARKHPDRFSQAAAVRAGIGWMLVDAHCPTDLTRNAHVELVASQDYSTDDGSHVVTTLQLWRIVGDQVKPAGTAATAG